MQIRIFGPIVAASLIVFAGEAITATRAFGYQELTCRKACLAKQYAAMSRCRSNCYMDRFGARRFCYDICVGRGH